MRQDAHEFDIVAHLANNPYPNDVIWGPPFRVKLDGHNGFFNFNYKVLKDVLHPPETFTLVSKVPECCQWRVRKKWLYRILQRRNMVFCRGCRILEVNGTQITKLRSKDQVLSLIQQSRISVDLLVTVYREVIPRPGARPSGGAPPRPAPGPAPVVPAQPALCQPRVPDSPPQEMQPHLNSYGEPRTSVSLWAHNLDFNRFLPYMKWRPQTIKIVLRKRDSDSKFGFKYTLLPQNIPKDEPTLIYCIVSDVNNVNEVGTPADTLKAWDLIVSVNNVPIHEVKAREAVHMTLETMFLKNEEITLIVQRLESIDGTLEQLKGFKATRCDCRMGKKAEQAVERCIIVNHKSEEGHKSGLQAFHSNQPQNRCAMACNCRKEANNGSGVKPEFCKSNQVQRVEKILRGGPGLLQHPPTCSCEIGTEPHSLQHHPSRLPEVNIPQQHRSVTPELHTHQYQPSVTPPSSPRSACEGDSHPAPAEGRLSWSSGCSETQLKSLLRAEDGGSGSITTPSLTRVKQLLDESETEDFVVRGRPWVPNDPCSSRDNMDSLSLGRIPRFHSNLSDLLQGEQNYQRSNSDHYSDNTVHDVVRNVFSATLKGPVTYPEKLHLVFFAEDEAATCTLEDAIFKELGISRDKPCYQVTSDGTLRNLPEDVKALCGADMAGELVFTQHLAQGLRNRSTDVQTILAYLETVPGGYTPRGMKGAVSTALLARFLQDESLMRSQFVEVVIVPPSRMRQVPSSRRFYFFHVNLQLFLRSRVYFLQKLCARVDQVLLKDAGQNVFLLTDRKHRKAGIESVINFALDFREYVGETFSQRLQWNNNAGHPVFLLGEREPHLKNQVRTILACPHGYDMSHKTPLVALALNNYLHSHNCNRGVSEKQVLNLVKEMTGNRELDRRTFQEVLCVLREKGHQIVPDEPNLRMKSLYVTQPVMKEQSCPGRNELLGTATVAAACSYPDQSSGDDSGAGNFVLPSRGSAEEVECGQRSASAISLQPQLHSPPDSLSGLSCPPTHELPGTADTSADRRLPVENPVLPSGATAREVECRTPANVISLDTRLDSLPCALHTEICDSLLLGEETNTNWLKLADILKKSAKDVRVLQVKFNSCPASIPGALLQEWANNRGTFGQLLRKLHNSNWSRQGLVEDIYKWFQNNPDSCTMDQSLKEWFERTLEDVETTL